MAILIRQSPEPLSTDALSAGGWSSVVVAPSDAGRALRQEMRRYCSRQIPGTSFLIAGHRGAGKTTLVADAIHALIWEHRYTYGDPRATGRPDGAVKGEVPLRPLPVHIHGPKLFDESRLGEPRSTSPRVLDRAEAAKPQAPGSSPEATPAPHSSGSSGAALVEIVLGVHRAVVREYAASVRRAVLERHSIKVGAAIQNRARGNRERRDRELKSIELATLKAAELATQFELEISEQAPTPSRLRSFYAQLGVLQQGVLMHAARTPDQGMRELLALHGVLHAHQRISGEMTQAFRESKSSGEEHERSVSLAMKGQDLAPTFASLGAGLGVAAASFFHALPAALLGLAAMFATSWSLKRESRSRQKAEANVDLTFIPRLDLETLDRVLPVLIGRLMDAGLAPVLIVDELDKVRDLAKSMESMVRDLKKLLAENVLTCFLADRAYLEGLTLGARDGAYGLTSSYFSHKAMVTFEPTDFEDYLRRVLEVSGPESGVVDEADDGPTAGPAETSDRIDVEVLNIMLRHRSELHALSLRRELLAIRTDAGALSLPAGAVRTDPIYRIDVTFQFAIELLLISRRVRAWLRQSPARRSMLLDALYYIPRQFRVKGGLMLGDTEPDGAFACYLRARIEVPEMGAGSLRRGTEATRIEIPWEELCVLAEVVDEMASFLALTPGRDAALKAWEDSARQSPAAPHSPGEAVLDALLLGRYAILAIDEGRQDSRNARSLYFRYSGSGDLLADANVEREGRAPERSAPALAPNPAAPRSRLRPLTRYSREYLSYFLATAGKLVFEDTTTGRESVFDLLQDRYRVLPTSPAWAQVSLALNLLSDFERGSVGETRAVEAASAAVEHFAEMLLFSQTNVLRLLEVCAFLSGAAVDRDSQHAAMRRCVRIVCTAFPFDAASADRTGKIITGLQKALLPFNPNKFATRAWRSDPRISQAAAASGFVQQESLLSVDKIRRQALGHLQLIEGVTSTARSQGRLLIDGAGASDAPDVWDEIEVSALEVLRSRIETMLGGSEPAPDVNELLARIRKRRSGTLLASRLIDRTLAGWTTALLQMLGGPWFARKSARHGAAQLAMAHALFRVLGVSTLHVSTRGSLAVWLQTLPWAAEIRDPDTLARARASWDPNAQNKNADAPWEWRGDCVVLIIRRAQKSQARAWTSRPKICLTLSMTEDEVRNSINLLSQLPGLVVAWELPVDETSVENLMGLLRKSAAPIRRVDFHFGFSGAPEAGQNVLVSPSGPDDIAQLMMKPALYGSIPPNLR